MMIVVMVLIMILIMIIMKVRPGVPGRESLCSLEPAGVDRPAISS